MRAGKWGKWGVGWGEVGCCGMLWGSNATFPCNIGQKWGMIAIFHQKIKKCLAMLVSFP